MAASAYLTVAIIDVLAGHVAVALIPTTTVLCCEDDFRISATFGIITAQLGHWLSGGFAETPFLSERFGGDSSPVGF